MEKYFHAKGMIRSIFAILILDGGSLFAEPWPGWRGLHRDGVSAEKGFSFAWNNDGPELIWQSSVGIGFSSLTVINNRVYTSGHTDGYDTVFCLNATTGDPVWKHSYEAELFPSGAEGGPLATPFFWDNRVYTLSRTGHFFCLNAVDGSVIWSTHLVNDYKVPVPQYGFAASPLVFNDTLYVDGGKVFAFDPKDGRLIWESADFGAGYSSPVNFNSSGKAFIANFNSDSLKILSASIGELVSSFPWETSSKINVSTPIIHDNRLFISSAFNMGCVLLDIRHPEKPEAIWRNNNMHNHFGSCVYQDGCLFGFDGHFTRNEGYLTCLDWNTGEVKWRSEEIRKGSLIIADRKLIILLEAGELIIAHASCDGYSEVARAQIQGGKCWTPLTLSDGHLYSRNTEGIVLCHKLTMTTSVSPADTK